MSFWNTLQPFSTTPVIGQFYAESRRNAAAIAKLDTFTLALIKKRRAIAAAQQAEKAKAGPEANRSVRRKSKTKGAAVGQDCLSLFLREDTEVQYSDKDLRDIINSLLLAGASAVCQSCRYMPTMPEYSVVYAGIQCGPARGGDGGFVVRR